MNQSSVCCKDTHLINPFSHHENKENDLLPDQSGSALASLGVFASPRVANPHKGRLRPDLVVSDLRAPIFMPWERPLALGERNPAGTPSGREIMAFLVRNKCSYFRFR